MPTSGRSGNSGRPKARSRSALQAALPRGRPGRVAARDVRVDARVPLVVVDAVQDARQVAAPASAGRRRSRNPCSGPWISRAYVGETVFTSSEKSDAALQVADRRRGTRARRSCRGSRAGPAAPSVSAPKLPLVGEVVDGEDARHAVERRVVPVERLQVDRHAGRSASRGRGRRSAARRGCGSTRAPRARGTRSAGGCRRSRRCRRRRARPVEEGRVLDEDDLDVRGRARCGRSRRCAGRRRPARAPSPRTRPAERRCAP